MIVIIIDHIRLLNNTENAAAKTEKRCVETTYNSYYKSVHSILSLD